MGGKLCAGKQIHAALLDQENEGTQNIVDRFVSECKLMSTVRHPNFVQFIDLGFMKT